MAGGVPVGAALRAPLVVVASRFITLAQGAGLTIGGVVDVAVALGLLYG